MTERIPSQIYLDSRALELAVEAKAIIQRHEETCNEDRIERRVQMTAIRLALENVKDEVRRTINRGMGFVIMVLIAALAYYLATDGLPGKR